MPRRPARPAPARAALAGLALALTTTATLGACSGDTTERTDAEPSTPESSTTSASSEPTSPTTDASTSAGAETSPTESAPSIPTVSPDEGDDASESPAATPDAASTETAAGLARRLLPARRVTGFNEEWRWRDGETRTAEPASGGIADCHRFDLKALGADVAATRTYLAPAQATDTRVEAYEVVAGFPDAQTASRAMSVLRSWQASCQRRLNRESDKPHRVSEPARPRAGDDAFAYLHTQPGSTADTTEFEDVGQVRVGSRVAIVVIRLDEIDYNYEPLRTPAARTLAAAASRLG